MTVDDITAVIVTRGDVDLSEIRESLPFKVIVWDNSTDRDLGVYGRYAACVEVMTPLAYLQDDDCVVSDPMAIAAAHKPGHVVCNMPPEFRPHYKESALVGFGAVCEPWLPRKAFYRFDPDAMPPNLHRECDTVFTALTPRILVDVPVRNLPWATAPDRLYRQEDHGAKRAEMLRLALQVRDAD